MENKKGYAPSERDITVNSCKVNFYKVKRGESVVSPHKVLRLFFTVSGEFSIYSNDKNFNYGQTLDENKVCIFFSKSLEFISEKETSELGIVEFDAEYTTGERISAGEFDGVFANFGEKGRKLFEMFFSSAKNSATSVNEIKHWVSLLVVKTRGEYLRSYKNTLEREGGAIFFGVAPECDGEFELSVTDAFLVITDNESGEKQAIKFSCENRFVERSHYTRCETDTFEGQKNLKFAKLKVPSGNFFKIWLFPEKGRLSLDVSPFTHSLKFSFSLKSNAPCKVSAGISNTADYEMVNRTGEVDDSNKWTDFLLTLFGGDLPEKTNRYVKEAVMYIDENFTKKITVPDLASSVHLHPNYLSRVFKEYMGCSISQYVNNKRVAEAKRLLKETDRKIDGIAASLGFYDSHHLHKCFKQITGYSPAEYREKL